MSESAAKRGIKVQDTQLESYRRDLAGLETRLTVCRSQPTSLGKRFLASSQCVKEYRWTLSFVSISDSEAPRPLRERQPITSSHRLQGEFASGIPSSARRPTRLPITPQDAFAEEGDSGALLVDVAGNAVAMLFAYVVGRCGPRKFQQLVCHEPTPGEALAGTIYGAKCGLVARAPGALEDH